MKKLLVVAVFTAMTCIWAVRSLPTDAGVDGDVAASSTDTTVPGTPMSASASALSEVAVARR